MNNVTLGRYGEEVACKYLKNQNYEILGRNFMCKNGEIDIIARDKSEIVFLEVKTRRSLKYGSPIEAVNRLKQKHIMQVANYYLYKTHMTDALIRFDIIEVYLKNGKVWVRQVKNVEFFS